MTVSSVVTHNRHPIVTLSCWILLFVALVSFRPSSDNNAEVGIIGFVGVAAFRTSSVTTKISLQQQQQQQPHTSIFCATTHCKSSSSNNRSTMLHMISSRSSSQSGTHSLPPSSSSSSSSSRLGMSVEGDFDAASIELAKEKIAAGSLKARMNALYKFIRPHTIRGTILASIAGTTRALIDTPGALVNPNWSVMLPRAVIGCLALLFGNAFIVGINQIYDKGIDELNKPFLPVASGEMSIRFAWIAVIASGIAGPVLVKSFFPALLFQLYSLGMFLGAIYSVPPIRTKKNPILAGLTIATVRGFLLNFGVYYAVKDAVGSSFSWSPKVAFIARFMTVFASVIAITKDLPDIEGDKAFEIETFATKVGVGKIAKGAVAVLFANYVHAMATVALSPAKTFHLIPMVGGHLALASMLVSRFIQLDSSSMASIKTFYKNIWDLFYLEYILYALI